MTESFAREYVAQMNFDEGNAYRQECIAQRDAGVGKRAGIDDDEPDLFVLRRVDLADQFVLGIALCGSEFMALSLGDALELGLDVLQSGGPVDRRFPRAEQIQIRTIEQ